VDNIRAPLRIRQQQRPILSQVETELGSKELPFGNQPGMRERAHVPRGRISSHTIQPSSRATALAACEARARNSAPEGARPALAFKQAFNLTFA
jgi:hypothetical protein